MKENKRVILKTLIFWILPILILLSAVAFAVEPPEIRLETVFSADEEGSSRFEQLIEESQPELPVAEVDTVISTPLQRWEGPAIIPSLEEFLQLTRMPLTEDSTAAGSADGE